LAQVFVACLCVPAMAEDTLRPHGRSEVGADALKSHGRTWAEEILTYETAKRRPNLSNEDGGPPVRVTRGAVKEQERVFDPVNQRYREPATEYRQRLREEENRVQHLNRAMDVQLLREQPFNVVTNATKLEGLDFPGEGNADKPMHGRQRFPDTFVDYNIVSNKGFHEHHWAHPDDRPQPSAREPRHRKVPAFTQKDYNIVTNRYLSDHDAKLTRDNTLNKREAAAKYVERNRFDPLVQKYTNPSEETNIRTAEAAHDVEVVERAQQSIPPCVKHRPSAYYDMVTHQVPEGNQDMLQWMDVAEEERKERFKNRYIVEHNFHVQDMRADQVENERRLNRIDPGRFEEPIKRGFDILSNRPHQGRHAKPPFAPYPMPKPSPWERAQMCRSGSLPPSPEREPSRAASDHPGRTAPAQRRAEPQAAPAPRAYSEAGSQRSDRTTGSNRAPTERSYRSDRSGTARGHPARQQRPGYLSVEQVQSQGRRGVLSDAGSMVSSQRSSLLSGASTNRPGATGAPRGGAAPRAPSIPMSDVGSVYSSGVVRR